MKQSLLENSCDFQRYPVAQSFGQPFNSHCGLESAVHFERLTEVLIVTRSDRDSDRTVEVSSQCGVALQVVIMNGFSEKAFIHHHG